MLSKAMANITVYTTRLCPYCHMAKELLRKKGAIFEEIDVGCRRELRAEMCDQGRRPLHRAADLDRRDATLAAAMTFTHSSATASSTCCSPPERLSVHRGEARLMADTHAARSFRVGPGADVLRPRRRAERRRRHRPHPQGAARRRRLRPDARNDDHHGARPCAALVGAAAGGRQPRRSCTSSHSRASSASFCTSARWRSSCDDGRLANRSFLISPAGDIAARYDKIHMFDVDLGGGESYRESANYQPGSHAVIAELPWGKLGLTICYDLRFPHLYRALARAGARFSRSPRRLLGRPDLAHWHTLLRARAIESQAYVFAAAQGGAHENGRETFGHSLVVSPWGEILPRVAFSLQSSFADVELQLLDDVRRRVPSLQHDRPFDVVHCRRAPWPNKVVS